MRHSLGPAKTRNVFFSVVDFFDFCALLRHGAIPNLIDHASALGQAEHVENERDPAIAHDAGAGITIQALQLFAQGFDYDFLGIADAIHDEAELMVLSLQNHNVDCIPLVGFRSPPATRG